jgi:hypothetical protein
VDGWRRGRIKWRHARSAARTLFQDGRLCVAAGVEPVAKAGGERDDGRERRDELGRLGTRCGVDVHARAREEARPHARAGRISGADDHLDRPRGDHVGQQLGADQAGDGDGEDRAHDAREEDGLLAAPHLDAVHQAERARGGMQGTLRGRIGHRPAARERERVSAARLVREAALFRTASPSARAHLDLRQDAYGVLGAECKHEQCRAPHGLAHRALDDHVDRQAKAR